MNEEKIKKMSETFKLIDCLRRIGLCRKGEDVREKGDAEYYFDLPEHFIVKKEDLNEIEYQFEGEVTVCVDHGENVLVLYVKTQEKEEKTK